MKPGLPGLSAAARKARLLASFVAGRPVHCTWQLTPRCESFCNLCEHRAESAREELDAADWARVAAELADQGSLLVTFTGAEPFLRDDLATIVSAVARRHFPLLVTNGWLVTEAGARAVWEAGLEAATVALEAAEPAPHDAVTGLPGSQVRAVAALAVLSRTRNRRDQRVNIRTRIRSSEVEGLEGLLELATRHDATVTVEVPVPMPDLGGGIERLSTRLRELKARHSRLRTGGVVLDRVCRALQGGVPGCMAGRAFFNVDHRGQVSRCLEYRAPEHAVGSLAAEKWRAVQTRLRASCAENECRACLYASRAEVETLYTLRGFLGGLKTLVGA